MLQSASGVQQSEAGSGASSSFRVAQSHSTDRCLSGTLPAAQACALLLLMLLCQAALAEASRVMEQDDPEVMQL